MEAKKLREEALKVLRGAVVGVLATASPDGIPHAAAVLFSADENLMVYFVTKSLTAKHKNLLKNDLVSLAVNFGPPVYIQIQGRAELVTHPMEREAIIDRVAKQGATLSHVWPPILLVGGDYCAYRVKPSSIRATDLSSKPILKGESAHFDFL